MCLASVFQQYYSVLSKQTVAQHTTQNYLNYLNSTPLKSVHLKFATVQLLHNLVVQHQENVSILYSQFPSTSTSQHTPIYQLVQLAYQLVQFLKGLLC